MIVSDRNASSDYVRFFSSKYLDELDKELIFNRDWRHPDYYEYRRRRSITCAEVLVPDSLPANFITGIYVSCNESYEQARNLLEGSSLFDKIFIERDLFFL